VIVDFWMLAGRVIRRWYLALPLLLFGVVVASDVASSVRPSYGAETQVLLAPSGTPQQAIANPLLLSNRGQLDAATQSVAFVVESPEAAEERDAAAPGADVSFSLVQEAPIVVIEVSAPSGALAQRAADVAVDQVDAALSDIEDRFGADEGSRIEAVPLADPTVQAQSGDRRRVLIGGLAAAFLGTTLVVLAVDQALRRRAERRLSASVEREVGRWAGSMAGAPPRNSPG
jgi:hypothetical protein